MIDKTEYDVIIVGAGPAGSSAARYAAEAGASVLLLEKRHEIGIPVRCGEGLQISTFNEEGWDVDSSWARQEIKGSFFHSPSGHKIAAKEDKILGYVLDRRVFDKMVAMTAAKAGADVKTGIRVTELLKDGEKENFGRYD